MYLHIIAIIIIFIESIIISQIGNNSALKKFYLFIVFTQLYVISAFRSVEIGNDTKNYFELYTNLASEADLSFYILRYEVGFLLYTKILTFFSSNPVTLNIVSSMIVLFLIFNAIYRNTNYIWLSILLFINLRYFYMSLNILRQFIAVALIINSVYYIYNGKFIKYVLIILLAASFHISAILVLPAYFVRKLNINKKNLLFFFAIAMLLFFLAQGLSLYIYKIFPRFEIYQNSVYFDNGIRIASVVNFLILFFILLVFAFSYRHAKINNISEEARKKLNILFYLFLIGVIFSLVSINLNLLDRFVIYFSIFSILLLPKILELLNNKRLTVALSLITFLVTFIYNLSILYLRPEWNHVYPYKFYWQ